MTTVPAVADTEQDRPWRLDYAPTLTEGESVHTCRHCRKPIRGSWDRFDKGVRLGDGTVIHSDVDLHQGCTVLWLAEHHPTLVDA